MYNNEESQNFDYSVSTSFKRFINTLFFLSSRVRLKNYEDL